MRPQISPVDSRSHRPSGFGRWGSFFAIWGAIGVTWCAILPLVAVRPAIKARLDELEARGIDASAMYYSELPAMNDVLRVLEEFRERHPNDLWVPIWSQTDETGPSASAESAARN